MISAFIQYERSMDLLGNGRLYSHLCGFSASHYSDALYDAIPIAKPDFLPRAVTSRKAEHLAGRYCAQRAMRQMGHEAVSVPIGPMKAPVWPSLLCGSISHTRTLAIACVAERTTFRYLGVDIEPLIAAPEQLDLVDNIMSPSEVERINALIDSPLQALTLVFSAKESLFKALAPSVGHYFDFLDAEMIALSLRTQRFSLRLVNTLTPEFDAGREFNGRFHHLDDQHLLTIVSE